jgi:hypothetical protein
VDKTPEAIVEFAAAQAATEWDAEQRPYLLARLSPDLAARGVNYREILGDQKLKDFIRTAAEKIKVVTHPTQKSKIGLIPPDKTFEYTAEAGPAEEPTAAARRRERPSASRRHHIVMDFLHLVSELDDTEAALVQIPTNILTKLMRDR